MKTTKHFFRTLLPIAALALLCAPPIYAQYTTLDLLSPTNPTNIDYIDAWNTPTTTDGFWTGTYNRADELKWIEFQNFFQLSHYLWGDPALGSQMTYWDGFTVCIGGDNQDYGAGYYGKGGSDGWILRQWGCMAGGGIKTKSNGDPYLNSTTGKPQIRKSNPYIVAYWGYSHTGNYDNSEWKKPTQQEKHCLTVKWKDGNLHRPKSVYICNHPWPYYGNIHGDGFARPFREGDHFSLVIRGLDAKGNDVGIEITHMLAEFKNGKLTQSTDWEYVDLSLLGLVSAIYFTMETTDENATVGPNTTVYFCMDRLSVETNGYSVNTPTTRIENLKATNIGETEVSISWKSVGTNVSYDLYLNGELVGTTIETSYTFTDLKPCVTYNLMVKTTNADPAGINVTTVDVTPPSIPANLRLSHYGSNIVATTTDLYVQWDASTDNVRLKGYHIYLDGEYYFYTTGTYIHIDELEPATEYLIEVEAEDINGLRSDKAQLRASTLTIYEKSITGLHASDTTEHTITIVWDKIEGVEYYQVQLNLNSPITTADTTYTFTDLTFPTKYEIKVTAENVNEAMLIMTTKNETPPTTPIIYIGLGGAYKGDDNISNTSIGTNFICVEWTPSIRNGGGSYTSPEWYRCYLNGELQEVHQAYSVAVGGWAKFTDLTPNTEYLVEVECVEREDLVSERAARYIRTLDDGNTPTNLENLSIDYNLPYQVFNIMGAYIGTTIPNEKGLYIIKQNNSVIKLLKHN